MHAYREIITQVVEIVAHLCFPAIVFTISSRLTFGDFIGELRRPVILAKIFLVSCVLAPLVTAWVVRFSDLPLVVAAILLVASMAPGDSFALLEAKDKKGRVSLAAAAMAWLCLAMPLTVPAWALLFSRWFGLKLMVSPAHVFTTVAPLTLIPLVAGMSIRQYAPRFSERLERIVSVFAKCSIAIVAIVGLVLSAKAFGQYTPQAFVAIAAVVTFALGAGYYSGCPERKDRITMALTASLGNFAVIILIAHENYPKAHVAGAAIAFVLVRWIVIMCWYLAMRLRVRLKGEALG